MKSFEFFFREIVYGTERYYFGIGFFFWRFAVSDGHS
ncbi:hypothetical protein AYX14_07170 [Cryptococcus neoformans]|nr:hypothetical protein AYX14_07170 [Cryptococcus neoformans var. grubii]